MENKDPHTPFKSVIIKGAIECAIFQIELDIATLDTEIEKCCEKRKAIGKEQFELGQTLERHVFYDSYCKSMDIIINASKYKKGCLVTALYCLQNTLKNDYPEEHG